VIPYGATTSSCVEGHGMPMKYIMPRRGRLAASADLRFA
jgi:hypothetical protein